MEKFKKIDKEFLITDSSLNVYSYRLLTSGYQLADFKKNPIGYYMHGTVKEFPREMGVLVKWEDLRTDGDKVYGKPVINMSHPRGQRTVDEIESGFLNAASAGHIVALEISSDPNDYLPDQKGPTVKKWFNRECSLVDIPGNYNALTDLFDENDQPLNLADFKPQNTTMKQIILTAAQVAMLPNLKADSDQAAVDAAFNDLIAKANKVDTLQAQVNNLVAQKTTLETEVADLKAAGNDKLVTDMLADALNKDKKITKALHDLFAVQYKGKPDDLKKVLDATPKIASPTENIEKSKVDAKDLVAKSWKELDESGKLEDLRAKDENAFFDKFKVEFGKKHNDDKREH